MVCGIIRSVYPCRIVSGRVGSCRIVSWHSLLLQVACEMRPKLRPWEQDEAGKASCDHGNRTRQGRPTATATITSTIAVGTIATATIATGTITTTHHSRHRNHYFHHSRHCNYYNHCCSPSPYPEPIAYLALTRAPLPGAAPSERELGLRLGKCANRRTRSVCFVFGGSNRLPPPVPLGLRSRLGLGLGLHLVKRLLKEDGSITKVVFWQASTVAANASATAE